MPSAKRRKVAPASEPQSSNAQENGTSNTTDTEKPYNASEDTNPAPANGEPAVVDKIKERQERFKALQARAVSHSIPISLPLLY